MPSGLMACGFVQRPGVANPVLLAGAMALHKTNVSGRVRCLQFALLCVCFPFSDFYCAWLIRVIMDGGRELYGCVFSQHCRLYETLTFSLQLMIARKRWIAKAPGPERAGRKKANSGMKCVSWVVLVQSCGWGRIALVCCPCNV